MNKSKNQTQSKSRKPINPKDRRYIANEHSIRRAIEQSISRRQINLRVQDICRSAGISSPTFYLHCRDSNDALRNYENALASEFQQNINLQTSQKEVLFLALLHFIARNQRYFTATLAHHDTWLLIQILNSLRINLIGSTISDKCFDIYTGRLSALIFCWGKYEHFSTTKIPLYAQKLVQTRVIDLGI